MQSTTAPVYVQTLAASPVLTLATAFIPRQIEAFQSLAPVHLAHTLSREEMSRLKWRRHMRWTRSERPVSL